MLLLSLAACLLVAVACVGGLVAAIFAPTTINLFAACLVVIAIDAQSDKRFDWLGGKVITHFGKISYGLYVYHFFLSPLLPPDRFSWIHNDVAMRFTRFFVLTILSVCIAALSWRLLERPVMKLKDRAFPVPVASPRPADTVAVHNSYTQSS